MRSPVQILKIFVLALLLTLISSLIMGTAFSGEEAAQDSASTWKNAEANDANENSQATGESEAPIAPSDEVAGDLSDHIETEQVDPALKVAQRDAAKRSDLRVETKTSEETKQGNALFGTPSVGRPPRSAADSAPKVAAKTGANAVALQSDPAKPLPRTAGMLPGGSDTASGVARTVVPEAAPLPQEMPDGKYSMKSVRKVGATDLVETLLEVTGTVKQYDDELKEIDDKMEVVAGFRYEERIDRFSILSSGTLRSVRQYNLAKAKMKIGDSLKVPELDAEQRTIVCSYEKNHAVLFSPAGPLKGEEMLLIEDLPGNTLILDRLLPKGDVAVGDAWTIDEPVLQAFLSVDAISESHVEAVLTAVADQMAMVEVVGEVRGLYLGAETEMIVRAKYQFDLTARRINWLGMMIEENRSIGHVGPGLDLIARLQVKISPLSEPQSLTDEVVEEVSKTPTEETMCLKYADAKGPWRFLHDRSWYVSQDDAETTILRKLSGDELVAQCNIADIGRVDLQSKADLGEFAKGLVQGLGANFEEIVSQEEGVHEAGYSVYCVQIDGRVDDLPLRWVYYLLTDKRGNQAVVVFVIEASQLEAFGDADRRIVDSFRIGR